MASMNRCRIRSFCFLVAVFGLFASQPVLAADPTNEFSESFDTKLYCDKVNTTAWWDTVAGELKLPPFELVLVGSCAASGSIGLAVFGDYAYAAVGDEGLRVLDITDPLSPVAVGGCDTPGWATAVAVSGNHAYVADFGTGLQVIDITIPTAPVVVGSCDTPGSAYDVAVSGNYAYVADGSSGLQVINITNPSAPALAGSYDTSGYAYGVTVSGDCAYVADALSGLQVIDISSPASPALAGSCDTPSSARQATVSGDYAYVADYASGLQVIDISNPASPVIAGSYDTPDRAYDMAVSGDYAYVADADSGIVVVDITNPGSPVLAGTYGNPAACANVLVAGEYAYVVATSGLLVIRTAEPVVPTMIAGHDTPGTAYHCVVSGDYAYVADYASGFQVVDISNPTLPALAGSYNTAGTALGIAVDGDHGFVADGTSGVQVIDISGPTTPSLTGSYDTPGEANAVVVAGDYVYVADGDSGLKVVDVTSLALPVLAGGYDTPGYAYGIAVDGDYAFVADGSAGLQVVDITNPAAPSLLGSCNTTGEARAVCVDGDYVYVADGGSGVEVISVSNPSAPSLVGNYDTQGFAYGITVAGDFAFVADGGAGFLVLDISDPDTPTLAGGLDTPGSAYGLTIDGDYAYLADGSSGLEVIEVFQRGYQAQNNVGQSVVFFEADKEISAVRFTSTQVDSIYWYASADSGVSWTYVPVDTFWHQIDVPGYDLAWRAELFSIEYHVNPTCTDVEVEWKYSPAIIDTVLDVAQDEGGWAYVRFASSGLDVASQGPSVVKHYYVHRRIDDIGFTEELKDKGDLVEGPVPITLGPGTGATSSERIEPAPISFPNADAYVLNGRYYFLSHYPVTGGLPPGAWAVVTGVPALQAYTYYSLAPTHADSMSTFEYTVYCVSAHTDVSTVYYVSAPDSGYSRDNLAPQPPADLKGDYAYPPSRLFLCWDRNRERDLSHYAVYKGTTADFVPGPGNVIGVPWDTSLVDDEFDPNVDNYYKVSAWDIHENEGDFSLLSPEDITQVESSPSAPVATRLEQNAPNPFNPATVIKYSVARSGWVTLRVYDVAGRGVRTLVARVLDPGWYEAMWDGRDDSGRSVQSGVYVYELQAPLHRETRKMVLLQ